MHQAEGAVHTGGSRTASQEVLIAFEVHARPPSVQRQIHGSVTVPYRCDLDGVQVSAGEQLRP
jgi:hypothetical protein